MSKELCKFCGSELVEGKCPNNHEFKKMCVNCLYSKRSGNGDYVCNNDKNMQDAKAKIEEAVHAAASGYAITSFNYELEPLPLKKPTAKCSRWEMSTAIIDEIEGLFK